MELESSTFDCLDNYLFLLISFSLIIHNLETEQKLKHSKNGPKRTLRSPDLPRLMLYRWFQGNKINIKDSSCIRLFFLNYNYDRKNGKYFFYYCTTLNKSGEEHHIRTPAFSRLWQIVVAQQYTISYKYAISSARRIFLQLFQ